jgi:enoyl-[acyl-carrier-protein] reductase (NADH)
MHLAAQPTRRSVTPEQTGASAVFLCIREAGRIAGTALPVDEGLDRPLVWRSAELGAEEIGQLQPHDR